MVVANVILNLPVSLCSTILDSIIFLCFSEERIDVDHAFHLVYNFIYVWMKKYTFALIQLIVSFGFACLFDFVEPDFSCSNQFACLLTSLVFFNWNDPSAFDVASGLNPRIFVILLVLMGLLGESIFIAIQNSRSQKALLFGISKKKFTKRSFRIYCLLLHRGIIVF